MNSFTFAGECSLDHGLHVTGKKIFDAPARSVKKISVPGRNGDLLLDEERYENIPVAYQAGLRSGNMATATFLLRLWLCRRQGYLRLEDSYDPGIYRLARYLGPMEFDMHALNRSGEVELKFDCKPQRFMVAGDAPTSYFNGNDINNPWLYPALPLIEVNGDGTPGTVTVGKVTVEMLDTSRAVILDCERGDAYYADGTNANGVILADKFPRLEAGANPVTFTGGVEYIVVTPRFWAL